MSNEEWTRTTLEPRRRSLSEDWTIINTDMFRTVADLASVQPIDEMPLLFRDRTLWTQEGYSNLDSSRTVKDLVEKWENSKS